MPDGKAGDGAPDGRVALAAVAGAHGVKGEVRVKLFAEGIDSLKRHRSVDVGGRALTVEDARTGKDSVLRFAEIHDRTAAEALRGALITVPRSALPPLEEGEYYHADLVGLACEGSDGNPLGVVVAIENFGAGDIVEIERIDGSRAMVPFRPGIADLHQGRIVIDPSFLA